MRVVSITAHGLFYAPEPQVPTATFFRHLCELGEFEFERAAWESAAYWFRQAYDHAPALCAGQPREVSARFRDLAEKLADPRMVAAKLRAGCEVLKGACV